MQAYLTAPGAASNAAEVNGFYNSATGLWAVTLLAPSSTGTYNLSVSLYCGSYPCSTQYPSGSSQVSKNFSITVSSGAPISVTGPAPTVTLSANPATVTAGQTTMLTWSSANATYCTASGGGAYWPGTAYTSGSLAQQPTANTTYTMTCTGPGGTNNTSVTVNVSPATAQTPTSVTVTSPISGQNFAYGSTMNIQWTPANGGVAEIQFVSTSGGESPVIYSMIVNSDPIDYSGSYSFQVSSGIPVGSYYIRLMNPENDQIAAPNPPGTVIGQSGVFTIGATTGAPTTSSVPTITSFSPSSAPAGTQVVVTGTGFTPTGDYVNFGGYGIQNLTAANATTLSFTVPPVGVGTDQVYVATNWGQSQPLSFTVTAPKVLSVSRNPSFTASTVTAGSLGAKIGSYIITNPSSEAVTFNSASLQPGLNAVLFQNMKVMVSGAQVGTTYATPANNVSVSMNGSLPISAGGSITMDIYAGYSFFCPDRLRPRYGILGLHGNRSDELCRLHLQYNEWSGDGDDCRTDHLLGSDDHKLLSFLRSNGYASDDHRHRLHSDGSLR